MIDQIISPVLFLLALNASTAGATTITWTVQNVTFNDGATASGSFGYDATTNQYSNFDVSVSTLPGVSFLYDLLGGGDKASGLQRTDSNAANLTGAHFLGLSFLSPLTNAGGTITLSGESLYGPCLTSDCLFLVSYNHVTGGTVQAATATPEPLSFYLLLIGLLPLAIHGERHIRRSKP